MLPGFRFLFAAVVLSLSLVVFGLGAVALLRSAHQEFSNLPIGRVPPETVFNRTLDNQPRLAMLRVDTPSQHEQPVTTSANPPIAPPANEDLAAKDPAPATDPVSQPGSSAAPSASVADASANAPTDANEPAADPDKVVTTPSALSPDDAAPAIVSAPVAATDATTAVEVKSIDATPANSGEATAVADSAPPATATAEKAIAAPPAPLVVASLAQDQTTSAPDNAGPAAMDGQATAIAPSRLGTSSPSAAMQVASLTALTATTEELTPGVPIPAGMVPLPRQRPPAKTKIAQKEVSKPRRIASRRVQHPAEAKPADSSSSPFD